MLIYNITLRHLLKQMLKMDYSFYSLLTLHLSKWLITIFICLLHHHVVGKKKKHISCFYSQLLLLVIVITPLKSILLNYPGVGLDFGSHVGKRNLVLRGSEHQ